MWIFLPNSFLSIVAPEKGSSAAARGVLTVRGRVKGDIEQVFPDAVVENTPRRDYAFRAEVARAEVAAALSRQVLEMDYTNFKSSIEESDRQHAAHRVWAVMNELQDQRGHGGLYNDPALWHPEPRERRGRRNFGFRPRK